MMQKALLYCAKAKPYLEYKQIPRTLMEIDNSFEGYQCNWVRTEDDENFQLNGKIAAECDFEVEKIFEDNFEDARDGYVEHFYTLKSYDDFDEGQKVLLKKSCLQKHELSNYLGFENGYAIHIKNLHIFDEPKELSEFYSIEEVGGMLFTKPLTKAPQNMQRVSINNWGYASYNPDDIRVLISIRSPWMCLILNRIKDIEVRKSVLNIMKGNL